ncbi:MAG TPA: SPOR domain-containing protein [Candidatus Binataceae bacterium]|nr:SPOR domain-containing protein [Candidatus Binataceae bacterium]
MRFEIRGGGFFMILVGILGLSGAVFMFGLLAGYDVGRQSASATQEVATTYSIPSAPLVTAASAPAPAPSAPASEAGPPEVAENPPETDSGDAEAKPVKAPAAAGEMGSGEGATNDEAPDENAAPPPPSSSKSTRTASAEANNPDTGDDTDNTAADDEAPPPPKHHGFNIQIQAAMDLNGANQMIRRLQRIGYPAHLIATPIDGQTWYKVEVGPYSSQEAATSAQTAMRQKYNDAYGHGGAAGAESAAPPSAAEGGGPTEE